MRSLRFLRKFRNWLPGRSRQIDLETGLVDVSDPEEDDSCSEDLENTDSEDADNKTTEENDEENLNNSEGDDND